MDDFNIVQLIGNVGFPIAITIYLLYRFEKRLEKLEDAIVNLATVVRNKE
ncbi:YvrJ family protein [Thermaerobacillus caldiproteolyticus]|nr:YvrJ family protein [Anoxybacillus caldiproteolyticus]QPA31256.1 YvrJ family protein [Anoxybacillus caldiproteolyticus]